MPRILLVEDDPGVRAVFEEILRGAGYDVDAAGTCAGGSELLRARDYDLLVTDGRLPDGTGVRLADEARLKEIATLIVTGYPFGLLERDRALDLTKYLVLRKPLRPEELLGEVALALGTTPGKPGKASDFDQA